MLLAFVPPLTFDPVWWRVDDPDHPDAIARSATGSILAAPPTDGTPYRRESVPVPDAWDSEAVTVTNADVWHADGLTGAGVSVAVFDLGWFAGNTDPAEVGDVVTHDCFTSPSCLPEIDVWRPNLALEGGAHGWACAEVIHDIAPDATLHLVRANSFTMYENAVAWAVSEGIDVVSMSLSFYNDSFYDGTGPHDRLMRDVEAAGVLFVKSAGNTALQHWSGPFTDADTDGLLDGDAGDGMLVDLPGDDATVFVAWNQFDRCGDTDLDAALLDLDGRIVLESEAVQLPEDPSGEGPQCSPTERLQGATPGPGVYRIEVRQRRGSRVGLEVDVQTRTGELLSPTASGSTSDPAAHPLAATVGAVRASRYWDGAPEVFSSGGPTNGGVPKPDVFGPDGLSTAAFGPTGFYGTSASTPAVAGLVALVLEDDPSLTPREAFERVQGWAHDTGDVAGRARLPARDPSAPGCGRHPLVLAIPLLSLWLPRRRLRTTEEP
jgi:subtilisin family serine protease